MKILVIVSASIAAYKSLDIIRELIRSNVDVRCVMTEKSEKFLTPLSLTTLSGHKAYTNDDFFTHEFTHIDILSCVGLIVTVPASANIIAKTAHGMSDELATSLLLIKKIPIIMIPAMNTDMWESAQVVNNVKILKNYGVKFMEPVTGLLACGKFGSGKLPEVREIVKFILQETKYIEND